MPLPLSYSRFQDATSAAGKPFEVVGPLEGPRARVRFLGHFNGEPTLWDARIMTLEAFVRETLDAGQAMPIAPRQFIDIGNEGSEGRAISIGLHVPAINEPTIWKTITMVRNYKRLRFGRIEWGTGPAFPA
jgi:hypothetical protein